MKRWAMLVTLVKSLTRSSGRATTSKKVDRNARKKRACQTLRTHTVLTQILRWCVLVLFLHSFQGTLTRRCFAKVAREDDEEETGDKPKDADKSKKPQRQRKDQRMKDVDDQVGSDEEEGSDADEDKEGEEGGAFFFFL